MFYPYLDSYLHRMSTAVLYLPKIKPFFSNGIVPGVELCWSHLMANWRNNSDMMLCQLSFDYKKMSNDSISINLLHVFLSRAELWPDKYTSHDEILYSSHYRNCRQQTWRDLWMNSESKLNIIEVILIKTSHGPWHMNLRAMANL